MACECCPRDSEENDTMRHEAPGRPRRHRRNLAHCAQFRRCISIRRTQTMKDIRTDWTLTRLFALSLLVASSAGAQSARRPTLTPALAATRGVGEVPRSDGGGARRLLLGRRVHRVP